MLTAKEACELSKKNLNDFKENRLPIIMKNISDEIDVAIKRGNFSTLVKIETCDFCKLNLIKEEIRKLGYKVLSDINYLYISWCKES